MFEVLMAMFPVAWMGIVTTCFEWTIDILYMCYDTFWMGFVGNCCDALISFPMVGNIVDTIWGLIV